MEIIAQQIEQHILIASEGNEIYNIADPTIYGKRITLAKSDSPDNWAERPETIEHLIVENIEEETQINKL